MASDQIDPSILQERLRVGAIIRGLREYRNLVQEALVHASGVSYRQLQRIEAGATNVGIDAYIKVAQGLDVPLAWLFAEEWLQLVEAQKQDPTETE